MTFVTHSRLQKRGGGLVETMVALMVMATTVTGACGIAVQTMQVSDLSRAHYAAATIAKSRIERMRCLPFDSLDLQAESNVRVNTSGMPDVAGPYRRTTTVRGVTSDLKEVAVTVQVQDRITLKFGTEKEQVTSLVANFQTRPSA